MLGLLGLEELIAHHADEYVETAFRVAHDRELRAHLATRIGEGLPALFERDEPIRALEGFLERAVRA
jgi:predicted O-linked N-acetylglucosamine transferase (SPINDLY family)